VIIDDAAGLQMGIDRNRTQIFEAALFHIPGYGIGESIGSHPIFLAIPIGTKYTTTL